MHDATGADVKVTDFAVAHLPFGKADVRTGGVNHGAGKIFQKLVIGGLACEGDGVAFGVGAIAPAIQHRQYDRFWSLGHISSGYMERSILATRGGKEIMVAVGRQGLVGGCGRWSGAVHGTWRGGQIVTQLKFRTFASDFFVLRRLLYRTMAGIPLF